MFLPLPTPPADVQPAPEARMNVRIELAEQALLGARAWLFVRPEVKALGLSALAPDLALGRLRVDPLEAPQVQALQLAPDTAWVLVDAQGQVLALGKGPVEGTRIKPHLEPPPLDALGAWLAKSDSHRPGHGSVAVEAIRLTHAQGLTAPDAPTPLGGPHPLHLGALPKSWGEVIQRLLDLPGWAESAAWFALTPWFDTENPHFAEAMAPYTGRFREGLREALERRSPSADPWAGGLGLMKHLGRPLSAEDLTSLVDEESLPTLMQLNFIHEYLLASKEPQALIPFAHRTRALWEAQRRTLGPRELNAGRLALTFEIPLTLAHLSLGQRTEARQCLERMRAQTGPRWRVLQELVRTHPAMQEHPDGLALVKDLLDLPALPQATPLPPPPPPLRLVGLGAVPSPASIRLQAPLSDYLDAELSITLAPEAEAQRLRRTLGLPEGPAWVLCRGAEVLGSQPASQPLASLLPADPPRLVRLRQRLKGHPEDRTARRTLLEYLLPRLPLSPGVEAEVLALARIHPDTLPLLPFPVRQREAWQRAAPGALDTLRAQLERWPDRDDLWQAWFAWAPFAQDPSATRSLLDSFAKPLDLELEKAACSTTFIPDGTLDTLGTLLDKRERWADLALLEAHWWAHVAEPRRALVAPLPATATPRKDVDAHAQRHLKALTRLGDARAVQAFEGLRKAWEDTSRN